MINNQLRMALGASPNSSWKARENFQITQITHSSRWSKSFV
jgi:hypothetical protein